MSDKDPAGGWTNHTGSSYNGEENSDECAWISPGQAGGAANVSFGTYGTYAEQASWSNDTNSCAISHPIVSHGGGGGGHQLVNYNSGKCAQPYNFSTSVGADVVQVTCAAPASSSSSCSSSCSVQLWRIETSPYSSVGYDYYYNRYSNQCPERQGRLDPRWHPYRPDQLRQLAPERPVAPDVMPLDLVPV